MWLGRAVADERAVELEGLEERVGVEEFRDELDLVRVRVGVGVGVRVGD